MSLPAAGPWGRDRRAEGHHPEFKSLPKGKLLSLTPEALTRHGVNHVARRQQMLPGSHEFPVNLFHKTPYRNRVRSRLFSLRQRHI